MIPGLKPALDPEATRFLSLITAAFTPLQEGTEYTRGDALST